MIEIDEEAEELVEEMKEATLPDEGDRYYKNSGNDGVIEVVEVTDNFVIVESVTYGGNWRDALTHDEWCHSRATRTIETGDEVVESVDGVGNVSDRIYEQLIL